MIPSLVQRGLEQPSFALQLEIVLEKFEFVQFPNIAFELVKGNQLGNQSLKCIAQPELVFDSALFPSYK